MSILSSALFVVEVEEPEIAVCIGLPRMLPNVQHLLVVHWNEAADILLFPTVTVQGSVPRRAVGTMNFRRVFMTMNIDQVLDT